MTFAPNFCSRSTEPPVTAFDGLERRQLALPVRRQRSGDQRHPRPDIAAVEGASAQLAAGRSR